jgi:acetylornithine deacetylase/succinyl-diaminopimelate desuccinylase-like protein
MTDVRESTTAAALARVDRARILRHARALIASDLPDGRESERAELVASMLDAPRIEVTVDPVLPDRPNVIARIRGRGSAPDLLLNAHLDSGFVPSDRWRDDPRRPREEGGRLFGGGVSDMLGGLASMIETVLAVGAGDPPDGDLVFLASMHHDSNGVGTKYAMANWDDWPRYAINGEPTGLSILSAHGGCVKVEVRFSGTSAHVSRLEDGHDALDAAVRFVTQLRRTGFTAEPHPALPGFPRWQVGTISGGRDASSVPDAAVVRADIRTVPGMSWRTVEADLGSMLGRAVIPGVTSSLHPLVIQRPFIGSASGPLMASLERAHRHIRGSDPLVDADPAARSFVTDAADLAHAGIETLVYGPGEWRAQPNEAVPIDELVDAARVYVTAQLPALVP